MSLRARRGRTSLSTETRPGPVDVTFDGRAFTSALRLDLDKVEGDLVTVHLEERLA